MLASSGVRRRLATTTGWRDLGREALEEVGAANLPFEPRLAVAAPPWTLRADVTVSTTMTACGKDLAEMNRRAAAEDHPRNLPSEEEAIWVWSDGSATDGVANGGGGALILLPDGETKEIRVPAGRICSSTRAELVALRAALTEMNERTLPENLPIVICLDSQAALVTLESGPAAQTSGIVAGIWQLLNSMAASGHACHLQWVPSHCGLAHNKRADAIAQEASLLDHSQTPIECQQRHPCSRQRCTQVLAELLAGRMVP